MEETFYTGKQSNNETFIWFSSNFHKVRNLGVQIFHNSIVMCYLCVLSLFSQIQDLERSLRDERESGDSKFDSARASFEQQINVSYKITKIYNVIIALQSTIFGSGSTIYIGRCWVERGSHLKLGIPWDFSRRVYNPITQKVIIVYK